MGKIYLVRHGEVQSNAERVFVGRADLPLNEKGLQQARDVAEEIAKRRIEKVYASSLERAASTGRIIAERAGVAIDLMDAFREFDYGEWEGMEQAKVPHIDPEFFVRWRESPLDIRVPGGETITEVVERAFPVFLEIIRKHLHEDIAVVAHRTMNRVLICCSLGVDPSVYRKINQNNACINTIIYRDLEDKPGENPIVIESINETAHLTV